MLAGWSAGWIIALGASLGDAPLANGGFEEKAGKDGRPAGWTFELGAQNGATKPESKVELDTKERHGGKSALRFSGNESTRGWLIAKQALEVRPGGEPSERRPGPATCVTAPFWSAPPLRASNQLSWNVSV